MIYLFIGEDELAKTEKIQSFKKQLFPPELEPFNYEVFSAKELTLPLLKEALSRLPVSAKGRLLVIKDALKLKDEIKECLLDRLKHWPETITVIFDLSRPPQEENKFLSGLLKASRAIHFKAKEEVNAFGLARAMERKQAESALNILLELFNAGEKAERIMGALRYQFAKPSLNPEERKKKISLLLDTDMNIKTGRLRPEFALEALIVKLCR